MILEHGLTLAVSEQNMFISTPVSIRRSLEERASCKSHTLQYSGVSGSQVFTAFIHQSSITTLRDPGTVSLQKVEVHLNSHKTQQCEHECVQFITGSRVFPPSHFLPEDVN